MDRYWSENGKKLAPEDQGATTVINQLKSGIKVLSEVPAEGCGLTGVKEKTEGLVWCLVDWCLFYRKALLKWLIISAEKPKNE